MLHLKRFWERFSLRRQVCMNTRPWHEEDDHFFTLLGALRGGKCRPKIIFEIRKVETYHYAMQRETPMETLSVNPVDRSNVLRENARCSRSELWESRLWSQ